MSILDRILGILGLTLNVAQGILHGNAATADAIAESLIKIIQAAIAAHESVTGQPIDLSMLKPIEPVP